MAQNQTHFMPNENRLHICMHAREWKSTNKKNHQWKAIGTAAGKRKEKQVSSKSETS